MRSGYFAPVRALHSGGKAGSVEAAAAARALEGQRFRNGFHVATMRAEDHQLIQLWFVPDRRTSVRTLPLRQALRAPTIMLCGISPYYLET